MRLGDGELWDKVASGEDVLCGYSLGEAAHLDPRLVEALVLQRIVRPLYLAILRCTHPGLSLEEADRTMKNAYIARNDRLSAGDGGITASDLAWSNITGWKTNSDVLVDRMRGQSVESEAMRLILRRNSADINRAFHESKELLQTVACLDQSNSFSWMLLCAAVCNMQAVVRVIIGQTTEEIIDDEIVIDVQSRPQLETDRFGAVSIDEAAENIEARDDEDEDDDLEDEFGMLEYEEHILSGHRAPVVGLPQYRRMGGRVF